MQIKWISLNIPNEEYSIWKSKYNDYWNIITIRLYKGYNILWTLELFDNDICYECSITTTEMLITVRNKNNNNLLQKISLKTVGISVGMWQSYIFVLNLNKLNKKKIYI